MSETPLRKTVSGNTQIIYHPNSSMFTIKPQVSQKASSNTKVVSPINTSSPIKIPFDSPSNITFQQAVKSSQPSVTAFNAPSQMLQQ
jgi:hypothetical protein